MALLNASTPYPVRPGMLILSALVLSGSFIAGLVTPKAARAGVTPIPIYACTHITQEGYYVVQNALSTASGDCLVVSASGVTINLNGKNITSTSNPKSGAGIHVKRNGQEDDNVTGVFIEGGFFPSTVTPTIRGFAAGVENEADGTVGDDLALFGNIDGLLIKGAKGSNFSDFNAGDNVAGDSNVNGVHIVGGGQNTIGSFSSAENNTNSGAWIERSDRNTISTNGRFGNNGKYGIWVDSSNRNYVGASSANSNGIAGVWLDSSSGNQLTGFSADSNGIVGVYIGCNPAFSGTASACSPKASSNSNLVFDIEAGKSKYGIVVDLDNAHNQITDNTANTNTVTDALDENPNCDKNNWFAGNYGTRNPTTCIN